VKAKEISNLLRSDFDVFYQESGSIGRRYAKADEIGVPFCITVDYDTLKDNTVTVRYRNDGAQERININELRNKIKENISQNKVRLT
ncbi:glycine--tRNA ligase, partial [Candidatus Micrarchaeota archaeon]|nr:glycine--tRNA ligase [Candidatus Micrarchaeota archaeon]